MNTQTQADYDPCHSLPVSGAGMRYAAARLRARSALAASVVLWVSGDGGLRRFLFAPLRLLL